MRYVALATDYDGTLATDGRVDEDTLAALGRLRGSGRQLLLVTGRELDDLRRVFPHLDRFDRVVAENGAVVYRPASREVKNLGVPPPPILLQRLRHDGVPFSVGRSILATWRPHETAVLAAIRDLGLEQQVIFNKDAVMVLPPGVNKASGLIVALGELGLSAHNIVAVGDAENDHALLHVAECGVAVANAVPLLKAHADLVTAGDHGKGVTDLIDQLIASDLAELQSVLGRRAIPLGETVDGEVVQVQAYGPALLLAGPSGAGKSTLATALVDRLAEAGYQFCLIDPEGDYENFSHALVLGSATQPPDVEAVVELLKQPTGNAVVNLTGLSRDMRPSFFDRLLPRLQAMRAACARPHWIVVDEAHHVLPATWRPASATLPGRMPGMMLVTLEPKMVAAAALAAMNTVLAVGGTPNAIVASFLKAIGERVPRFPALALAPGQAALWRRATGERPVAFTIQPPESEHRRHRRKYAEGELEPDENFHFRGPEGKLNLRAQNLTMFVHLAEGVDEDTWNHHLKHGDYSRWFRDVIKDAALADQAAAVERATGLPAAESRQRIKSAIEERYTV